MLRAMQEAKKSVSDAMAIPPGYLEIRLSTKGKMGAPEIFHVRNFKVSDIMALSLTSDSDLPSKLAAILNEMIYEDVDVTQWHEKEVEELMVYIFKTFYKDTIEDIPFPLEEEDYTYLKENAPEKLEVINNKKWTPKTTVSISRDVELYEIGEDFNPKIKITNKTNGFYVVFDYIKYGDQLVIKKWLDEYFAEEEEKFKDFKAQIRLNSLIMKQIKTSPDALDRLLPYNEAEEAEYNEYMQKRLQVLSEVVRLISIVDYNGQDVSSLPLDEKYNLIKDDARIDYGMIRKLNTRQQKLQFGIKPEVSMLSPITEEVVKRPFSFRLSTLLQAMQLSGDDVYDDGFDDED